MHSILLIVEMPPMVEKQEERNVYVEGDYGDAVNFLKESAYKNKDLDLLGDNVLLFEKGAIEDLFAEVRSNLSRVPYRYITFDEPLRWRRVARKAISE